TRDWSSDVCSSDLNGTCDAGGADEYDRETTRRRIRRKRVQCTISSPRVPERAGRGRAGRVEPEPQARPGYGVRRPEARRGGGEALSLVGRDGGRPRD